MRDKVDGKDVYKEIMRMEERAVTERFEVQGHFSREVRVMEKKMEEMGRGSQREEEREKESRDRIEID